MADEIERKFLVHRHLLTRSALGRPKVIHQGYLAAEPAVRVRTVRNQLGVKGFLTVKGPGSLVRKEFEYEVPVQDAEDMLKLARFGLSKERNTVRVGKKNWEVDYFTEERMGGLILAEVELRFADEEFEMPEWAAREVTDDPGYSNVSLAKIGLPPKSP